MEDDAIEWDGHLESPLIRFLHSFKGLEDLFLMHRTDTMGPRHWPSLYWDAILHHSSTLKGLVYHERVHLYVHKDWGSLRGERREWFDTRLSDFRGSDSWINHFYNAGLAQTPVQCFGIADNFSANLRGVSTRKIALGPRRSPGLAPGAGTRLVGHGLWLGTPDRP